MNINYHLSRTPLLQTILQSQIYKTIINTIQHEQTQGYTIYPTTSHIFKAFELSPRDQVKVVILGQDPYHQPRQAMGLAFSVPSDIPKPPSLINIYKELAHQYPGYDTEQSGDLTRRATQGVLLLNTSLTVRANEPNSHSTIGRHYITDTIITQLSQQKSGLVFMLRGKHAQSKMHLIDTNKHLILTASHPSPLSAHRGRFGNNHFVQANDHLIQQGNQAIKR